MRSHPARLLVERPGDHFAGPGLVVHGGLHRRHLLHLAEHRAQRRAVPHDPLEAALLGDGLPEIRVFQLEPGQIALDFLVQLRVADGERRLVAKILRANS
jgi:hypothetical protein